MRALERFGPALLLATAATCHRLGVASRHGRQVALGAGGTPRHVRRGADGRLRLRPRALRRGDASYGYVSTGKRGGVITSSVLDYMKHKASAAVEVRFLRNFTLRSPGTVYDRYGAYTHYLRDADGTLLRDENGSMLTEQRDFEPYFLLDGRLSWEKGVVRLYVDATNLTGADYFDFGGLRLPGRWFRPARSSRSVVSTALSGCHTGPAAH